MAFRRPRLVFVVVPGLIAVVAAFYLLSRLARLPEVASGPLVQAFPAVEKLRFFALGDTGSGSRAQRRVARAMERRCQAVGVDGLLFLGDIFYPDGVSSVDDPRWRQLFFDIYNLPCLTRAKIFPVLGNHDYKGNAAALIEYSRRDRRWVMPHRFYRVDFGSLLRLVALDSWLPDICLDATKCGVDFVRAALDADNAKRPWKIVFSHFPLTSVSRKGGGHRGAFRGWFLKRMLCGKTHVYISGHAHHLEHRELRDCGISHFVSGGGGKSLFPITERGGAEFAASKYGFLELEVEPDTLHFRFIDVRGVVLHETAVTKQDPDQTGPIK